MKYQSENFNGCFDFKCRAHNGWIMESHLHEYSEFLYCKKGSTDIFVNGKHIHLSEKHLVWIPPNYIHQYKQTDANLICAVFSNDFIPLFSHLTKEKRLQVSAIDFVDTYNIFDVLHTISPDNLMLISGYLNLICAKVIEQSSFEPMKQLDGVLYQKVISYLSSHFKEEISLKHLAKKFGYNEKYLSHSLHELTGVHFSKLLALYRIEHARNMLIGKPDYTISEIALSSGFTALNTFNRVFKEITGVTPSQYKNTYAKRR